MPSTLESIEFRGVPAVRLQLPNGAQATISLLGGQVLSWIPPKGRERFYLSDSAVFDGSKSIRGGVPICFPQFSGLGNLPKHGFLRTVNWSVTGQKVGADYAWVALTVTDSEATRALWPHSFRAEVTVGIEANHLAVELEIENTGDTPFEFTGALHSYLKVAEAENVMLKGLYGLEYRDAAKGNQMVYERAPEVWLSEEVDRVYHRARRPLWLDDALDTMSIQQEGFPDVVVWNPWEERCLSLDDMGHLDFRKMVCVEAAIAQHPISLPAGEVWWGRQAFRDNPPPLAADESLDAADSDGETE